MINVKPRYHAFTLAANRKEQLLSADLPDNQINNINSSFTELHSTLPMEIKNTVVCDLYFDGNQCYLPILLWVDAKSTELFDIVDFRPWKQAVSLDEPLLWTSINQKISRLLGRNSICAIVGCKEGSQRFTTEVQQQAFQAGRLAALSGYSVLTGGLSGVMSKAAQGAGSIQGATLGILPGTEKSAANKFIDNVFPSGIGIARNYQIALSCDVMIAVNGGRGTMEEICFALDFDKPVISWDSWQLDGTEKATDEHDIFRFLIEQKENLICKLFDQVNSRSE